MTNEEIIAILENYKDYEDSRTEDLLHHGYDNTKEATKRKEALDEAIKALSENKGDLISRETVQAEINKCHITSGVKHQGVWNECVDSILRTIDYIPSAENKGEWIPVSERLPEKNVWVLVSVEQSGKCFQEIMRRNNYKEGWTDNIDFYTDEITAWQPLPEPYKEGGKE